MEQTGIGREMPRYRCHKEVWALKIKAFEIGKTGSGTITPYEAGYGPVSVSREWAEKHQPIPGGYYVVYEDGYKSFSPAKAFEGGYIRI